MKNNHSKEFNLYTQGQRWAVRGLLMVGTLVSWIPQNTLAAFPGPGKMAQCAVAVALLLVPGNLAEDNRILRRLAKASDDNQASTNKECTKNQIDQAYQFAEISITGTARLSEEDIQAIASQLLEAWGCEYRPEQNS